MSEIWQITLTAALTIIGGITIYVIGRIIVPLFIEPMLKLRGLIGEISYSLIFYADVYSNPTISIDRSIKYGEAIETFRRQASQLRAIVFTMKFYPLWERINLVPEKVKVIEASSELIGLSNGIDGLPGATGAGNAKVRQKVEELLGIRNQK